MHTFTHAQCFSHVHTHAHTHTRTHTHVHPYYYISSSEMPVFNLGEDYLLIGLNHRPRRLALEVNFCGARPLREGHALVT